jgi:hypothetical protein
VFVDNPSAENFIHTGAGGDHLHLGGVGTATTGADGDTIHLFYGTYDVDAGEGDDTFFLHASWAPHEITLGAGSDRLKVINWQQIANVEDFTVGPGGDVLDLSSALLVTATEDNIAEIVGFTPDVSGGTIVSIDPDASGSESAFTFSVFHNTSGLDAVDMFNNGNIYVV